MHGTNDACALYFNAYMKLLSVEVKNILETFDSHTGRRQSKIQFWLWFVYHVWILAISSNTLSITVCGRLSVNMSSTKQSSLVSLRFSNLQVGAFLIKMDLESSGIMIRANL